MPPRGLAGLRASLGDLRLPSGLSNLLGHLRALCDDQAKWRKALLNPPAIEVRGADVHDRA
eukprot:7880610-Alexandrium_andersonii.AAC.1